ncbi:MAG TPA: hypothetical protein PK668_09540 [Myxococcota bacterium]|nr:hypothetical protein [Myxococcota bacterium]HRY92775.1 hypothetical protein [Myxococcota bacterium]
MRRVPWSALGPWLVVLAVAGGCGSEVGNRPPVLLSLETNVSELLDGATVTVLAAVSDPDGPQDLVGGVLRDADGALLGAFEARSQGLFQLELGWPAFAAVEPFDFYGDESRDYRVSFTDFQGEEAAQTLTLAFRCPDLGGGCGSGCQRLDLDSACGACGRACGQGEECDPLQTPPACAPRSVALDEFGPEFGIEYCEMLFRCCDYEELQDLGQDKFSTLQGCIDFTALFFRDFGSTWQTAVAAGRASYDPVLAGACLESMGSAPCGAELAFLFGGCQEFFHGTQPSGAECASPLECADGTSCVIPQGEEVGTCLDYLVLGAVCNLQPTAPCDPRNLFCDSLTHLCTERKPAGSACADYSECQSELECSANQCQAPEPICDGS